MSKSDDTSEKRVFALIHADFDGLSDAAKTFVEKASDAVGGLFKPWQIGRIAKAEANASIVAEQAKIEITDLQRRAAARWLAEEEQKQKNMERITEKAVPHVSEAGRSADLDKDWLVNFYDKARLISDSEMQELWAKILAGEANTPGKVSKRTINLMASLDKTDAEMFKSLRRFIWYGVITAGPTPLVFDHDHTIYKNNGVSWQTLRHLDDIGLISFETVTDLIATYPGPVMTPATWPQGLRISTYGSKQIAWAPNAAKFPVGQVKLTRAGEDLCPVVDFNEVPGFFDFCLERFRLHAKAHPTKVGDKITPAMFFRPTT